MGNGKRVTGNGGAYTGLGKKHVTYIHDTGFLLFLVLDFVLILHLLFLIVVGCRILGIQSDSI